jgi:hypothetical protein
MATIKLQRITLNQEILNLLIFDDYPGWREEIKALPKVRMNSLTGGRYVANKAISKHRNPIDDLFEIVLEGWVSHLK